MEGIEDIMANEEKAKQVSPWRLGGSYAPTGCSGSSSAGAYAAATGWSFNSGRLSLGGAKAPSSAKSSRCCGACGCGREGNDEGQGDLGGTESAVASGSTGCFPSILVASAGASSRPAVGVPMARHCAIPGPSRPLHSLMVKGDA